MALVVKTPGVYTEEISLFPPSVAQVETAVPAFIGYTQSAEKRGESLRDKPELIRSLADFQELFGAAPDVNVNRVEMDAGNSITSASLTSTFLLYDSMRLFFANGGSKCYIVSVGDYNDTINKARLSAGLAAVAREDEPTLLVIPDAVQLKDDKFYTLQQEALKQSGDLKDRFAILDLLQENGGSMDLRDSIADFRNKVGMQNLKYGAAYGPWLKTNLSKTVKVRQLTGHLFKLGNPVSLSNLTEDGDTQQAISRLTRASADTDRLFDDAAAGLKKFLADNTTDAESVDAGYQANYNSFRTALVNFQTGGGDIATVQTAYQALFNYIYILVNSVVDEVAKADTDFSSRTVDDPDGTTFLTDYAQTLITNSLHKLMQTLNTYTIGAGIFIATAGNHEDYFVGAHADAMTAAVWTKDGDDAFDKADLPGDFDLTAIFPEGAAGPADDLPSNTKRAKNMESGALAVSKIFKSVDEAVAGIKAEARALENSYHETLVDGFPLLRNLISRVSNAVTELPPSAAIAGAYAAVDASRGVHKAPANVSLSSIKGVSEVVTHAEQADYNVDTVAGKSVNIIRPFIGKGILVWGARTLDGNSNEWRYVNVRRFFNMVEESVKKASSRFVFEPNDKNTWVKVRGMIENFLLIQWRNGALAGAVPDDAFFVNVGLGQTMTAQDINEGKLIVEIGMAAVRPAEFIILRFSHKMQVS
ncbi:MAG: phage tail sheath subtilisin-like domain-containing protein [gamma proteobacterium endosymbiont of Lamellibrachia anaximandri]|nr:phage tail sheath subtilisin-like domain-containing protein [gamma proteobacterium endosymbiont of Lamellibrachia anaximandri]MBL3532736.1 phage tail sheath subtilisin-like domain-containing protein [gamma proteobacterium endosymbiont of Lamellibrachia anaximandri]